MATREGQPYGSTNYPPPNADNSIVLFIYAKPQNFLRWLTGNGSYILILKLASDQVQ